MLLRIALNEYLVATENPIHFKHFSNSFTSRRTAPHIILQNHLPQYFKQRLPVTTVHQEVPMLVNHLPRYFKQRFLETTIHQEIPILVT